VPAWKKSKCKYQNEKMRKLAAKCEFYSVDY